VESRSDRNSSPAQAGKNPILVKGLIMSKFLYYPPLFVLTIAVPAFAGVSISSPGNGADVSSPFNLSAYASTCSNQAVSAMGYSFDNSADTTVVNGTSVDRNISAGDGTHTLHVKAWGEKGASCVTDVTLHVTDEASSNVVPSDAKSVSAIQLLGSWAEQHDPGVGGGWSSGNMSLVGSPSRSGHARKFVTGFSNASGELYHVSFGDDTEATNFFYDAWVYLTSSVDKIENLEMDMNQTMSNGQTVIYGFQCDGWTGTWDFTKNAGTPKNHVTTWVHSGAGCNPRNWGTNTWHHVQISYSRNGSGAVTYKSVWLDGKEQQINATVPSAFALGWGPTLLTNFQVDGLGAGGTSTVYLDDLKVSWW
jgi:hypothetical protein